MMPLFSYGTLRDAELQRELFDREYPTRPATLEGYVVVAAEGGYLSVVPRAGGRVRGALVALDEAGFETADRWEDLNIYRRARAVAVDAGGSRVPCFVYLRHAAAGPVVDDRRLSTLSRARMIADIRAFRGRPDEPSTS